MNIKDGNLPPPGIDKPLDSTPIAQVLDALDRPDFRSVHRMLDRIDGLGRTVSGYPIARPGDFASVIAECDAIFQRHKRLFEAGHEQTILDYRAVLARLAETSITTYGAEATALRILTARFEIGAGNANKALALVDGWADRPYRVEGGVSQVADLFEIDLLARLILGKLDEVHALATARIQWLIRYSSWNKGQIFERFHLFLAVRIKRRDGHHWLQSFLAIGAKQILIANRRGKRNFARRLKSSVQSRFGHTVVRLSLRILKTFVRQQLPLQLGESARMPLPRLRRWRASEADVPVILVTRAMGGLGDITMMTPGLRALSLRYNRKIAFAIPKKFHAAFDGNPYLDLLDSDGAINLGHYRKWINLGICPAAFYESRVAPHIKKGRVELFARGVGIKKRALNKFGWTPVSILDEDQNEMIAFIREFSNNRKLPIIGVQMFSRETYRDYPRMNELLEKIASFAIVLPIHTVAVDIPIHKNIMPIFGKGLKEAIAMVAASDVFVSVDSAFYHTASAFGMPTIGLFGPTDGKTCSAHHENTHVVQKKSELACAPCWRNEDMNCSITKTRDSACLAAIEVDEVLVAIRRAVNAS